jgi:hypothetical protein
VPLSDGVVHAPATGTVVNANSALITLEKNCPILIRVYRDRVHDETRRRAPAHTPTSKGCVARTSVIGTSR